MRYALAALVVFGALTAAVLPRGEARADEGWDILSMDVHYTVREDGSIDVVETLRVDFGAQEKHGIFRYFWAAEECSGPRPGAQQPVYACPEGRDRLYDYNVEAVTRVSGRPWPSSESTSGGKLTVKIGDPDETISGRQSYVLRYTVRGALDRYDDHDELYWDASGEWPVPIDAFTMTVVLPAGANARSICFVGYTGSTEECTATSEGEVTRFEARPLLPDEQVTVAVGWQPGLVRVAPPMIEDRANIGDFFTFDPLELGGLLLGFVAAAGGVIAAWWRHGRDRAYTTVYYLTEDPTEQTRPLMARTPVVVEYLPPEDLRPAQMGVLLDERADTLDVTATIVDLAVRGYLHITEIPKKGWFGSKDWRLTRQRNSSDLAAFEAKVLDSLFATGDEVELSDLKDTFADELAEAKALLYEDAVARKWFTTSPERARGAWVVVAVGVGLLGIGLSLFAATFWHRGLLFLGLIPAGALLLVMSRSMARRSAAGSEVLRRVLGFRLYITTAETDRQRFNEEQGIFARYLPYAIVFGCVSKWAKAFEGLEDEIQRSTSGWYSGNGAFQIAAFSSALQSFSSSVSSTISSTPSSGGSGFSGGSSGGGGGGGGGGSW